MTVDEYISAQPDQVRPHLERLRTALQKALPDTEEVISYGMPTFKLNGRVVIHYAGWKEHYAIYPASLDVAKVFRTELEPYQQSKGTIRFPLTGRMPVKLISDIAKFRARQVAEKASSKKKR